jgi:tetratricopeptide (TPR) repeat protein
MLSKFFLFYLLTYLFGSPILALLILLALYLAADIRYLGWTRRFMNTIGTESEIRELSRQVALNPHNASALNDLGRLLCLRGRFRKALPFLERALERMADSPETHYYFGLASLHSGREAEGEREIARALEINPRFRYGEPYIRLGEYLLRTGRTDEAKKALEKGVEIHSSNTEGWYLLGMAHEKKGEKEEAKAGYRKAIESYRSSPSYKRRDEWRFALKARMAARGV